MLVAACFLKNEPMVMLSQLWLSLSLLLWSADLFFAGGVVDSAVFTHLGSFVIAVFAMRQLQVSKGLWRWACLGLGILMVISRVTTSPKQNINLAFTVAKGWESVSSYYALYLLFLTLLAATVFYATERIILSIQNRRR